MLTSPPTAMKNIPLDIVDISEINKPTALALLEAAKTQGFLFVKGHSFSKDELDTTFKLAESFFKLPYEYKSKHEIDEFNHGYTASGMETLDPGTLKKGDPKEAFNIGGFDFVLGETKKHLPDWFDQDPLRRRHISTLAKKMYATTLRLLKLLAIALEIEPEDSVDGSKWFESRYDASQESGSTLRFLHYPSPNDDSPEVKIRAGAHTDYGSMTLLFQQENQEGLEIYSPVTKKWEAVPFVGSDNEAEGAPIIVNIGDQLSFWTAGLLKSTIHRVKFPEGTHNKDRYSVVFFSHPNDATELCPVPSPIIRARNGRGPQKAGKVLTAREHLDHRLAVAYGKAVELT